MHTCKKWHFLYLTGAFWQADQHCSILVPAYLVQALLKQGRQPAILLHSGTQVAATCRLLFTRQHHANAAGTHKLAHLHQVKKVCYSVAQAGSQRLSSCSPARCPLCRALPQQIDCRSRKSVGTSADPLLLYSKALVVTYTMQMSSRAPARTKPLQSPARQTNLTVLHLPCYKQHLCFLFRHCTPSDAKTHPSASAGRRQASTQHGGVPHLCVPSASILLLFGGAAQHACHDRHAELLHNHEAALLLNPDSLHAKHWQ